jgi:16S rRNA U1498 N3-methylase RsmE
MSGNAMSGDRARISVNAAGGQCRRLSNPSIEASEDLSELASDDSESRSKIEATTGVGNNQER